MNQNPCVLRSILGAVLLSSISAAFAGIKTWDGGGGSSHWTTAANWSPDGVPTAADDVVLDNSSVAGSYSVSASGGVSCRTLQIGGGGSFITLDVQSTVAPALTIAGSGDAGDDLRVLTNGKLAVSSNAQGGSSPLVNNTAPGSTASFGTGAALEWRATPPVSRSFPAGGDGATTFSPASFLDFRAAATGTDLSNMTVGHVSFLQTGPVTVEARSDGGTTISGNLTIGNGVTLNLQTTGVLALKGNLVHNGTGGSIAASSGTLFASETTYSGSGTTLTLAGDWRVAPTANLRLARSLEVAESTTATIDGTLTVSDWLFVKGHLQVNDIPVTGTGNIRVEPGALMGTSHRWGFTGLGALNVAGLVSFSPEASMLFNRQNEFQAAGSTRYTTTVRRLIFDGWSMPMSGGIEATEGIEFRNGLVRNTGTITGPDGTTGVIQQQGRCENQLRRRLNFGITGKRLFPVNGSTAPGGFDIEITSPGTGSGLVNVEQKSVPHPDVLAGGDMAFYRWKVTPPAGAAGYTASLTLRYDGGDTISSFSVPVVACYRNGKWTLFRQLTEGFENGVWTYTVHGITDISGEWMVADPEAIPADVDVEVVPSSHDFGAVDTDQVPEKRFRIYNNGNPGTLNFTGAGIEITGPDAGQFSLADTPDTTPLYATWSQSEIVRFRPTSPGPKSANLVVITDDPDEPTVTIPLTGVGIHPDISVSTDRVTFGEVHVNDGAVTRAVTITNQGITDLVFSSISLSAGASPAYSIVGTPDTTPLPPLGSRQLIVSYDPSAAQGDYGTITISSNDFSHPVFTVYLSGTGILQNVEVTVFPGVSFGQKVVTEGPTRERQIRIRNSGTAPLAFTGAGVSTGGANASEFHLGAASTAVLPPFQSRVITLVFDPASTGNKEATLSITTNDPNSPVLTFILTGTGVNARPAPASGPYTGHGPGTSTIGAGGDYPTMKAACDAISSHPLTGGDWTFRIISNLTGQAPSSINQYDTNGHRITFRPAPGVNPVVSFGGLPHVIYDGYLIIGVPGALQDSFASILRSPTDNIIIDGCEVPGGTTRNLTLRGPGSGTSRQALILVAGDCDNIAIRNCVLKQESTASLGMATRAAVLFSSRDGNYPYATPHEVADAAMVENCEITVPAGYGIVHEPFMEHQGPAADTRATGIQFTGNQITAGHGAVRLVAVKSADVSRNEIRMWSDSARNMDAINFTSYGPRFNNEAVLNVTRNRIRQLETTYFGTVGMSGINLQNIGTTCTYNIWNNEVGGIRLNVANPPFVTRVHGITCSTGQSSRLNIFHNSVHVMPFAGGTYPSSPPQYLTGVSVTLPNSSSFVIPLFSGTVELKNNIVRMGQSQGDVFYCPNLNVDWKGDFNNFHAAPGARIGNFKGVSYTTLEAWNTATGFDLNSVSLDPVIGQAPSSGKWVQALALPSDLHFSSNPGPSFSGTPLAGVTTDIDGETRSATAPLMGADEVPDTDQDGVPDKVENSGPGGADGNNDGTSDSLQGHVTALPNAVDGQYIVLVSAAGTILADVTAHLNPSPGDAPTNATFPYGFLSFTIRNVPVGGTATLDIILPAAAGVNGYLKHVRLSPASSRSWLRFTNDGSSGLQQIDGRIVRLRFVDGGRGDDDLTANGEIRDPGAPAVEPSGVPDWALY